MKISVRDLREVLNIELLQEAAPPFTSDPGLRMAAKKLWKACGENPNIAYDILIDSPRTAKQEFINSDLSHGTGWPSGPEGKGIQINHDMFKHFAQVIGDGMPIAGPSTILYAVDVAMDELLDDAMYASGEELPGLDPVKRMKMQQLARGKMRHIFASWFRSNMEDAEILGAEEREKKKEQAKLEKKKPEMGELKQAFKDLFVACDKDINFMGPVMARSMKQNSMLDSRLTGALVIFKKLLNNPSAKTYTYGKAKKVTLAFIINQFTKAIDRVVKEGNTSYTWDTRDPAKKLSREAYIRNVIKWLTYVKNSVPRIKDELEDHSGGEKPTAPLGRFAFPGERTKNNLPFEPNTDLENSLQAAIDNHFHDNEPMPTDAGNTLRKLLSKGLYDDVIKEPKTQNVYRGMCVSEEWLRKITKLPKTKEIPEKGSVEKSFTFTPRHGSSTSWTTEEAVGWRFAKDAHRENEEDYLIIIVSSLKANPNRFLAADDGLYKLKIPAQFNTEQEATGLGPIKVTKIEWKRTDFGSDDDDDEDGRRKSEWGTLDF